MKAFMYMVGYDQSFQTMCNSGWGCGYVAIPVNYKSVKKHFERIERETKEQQEQEDFSYVDTYFETVNFEQEITYTETEEINGDKYLVIGFDTAHYYNGEQHNFSYVYAETLKILKAIEDYE